MAYIIENVDLWMGTLEDKPGALAEKLAPLADAGIKLDFVLARRDAPGKGLLFVAPLKGAAQASVAKKAGLGKKADLAALCVSGADKVGLLAAAAKVVSDAGINMRGASASAIGRKGACYLAFDSKQDAAKAARVLKKVL